MGLIDSDALKKDIEKQAVLLKIMFGDDEDMMTIITELYKGFMAQIDKMPTIEEPKWIPVTEQTLPNHNSVVVVCGEKGTWDFGTYRGLASTNVHFWNWKKNTVKEVHWWMYKEDALPMPWKGGQDGNK